MQPLQMKLTMSFGNAETNKKTPQHIRELIKFRNLFQFLCLTLVEMESQKNEGINKYPEEFATEGNWNMPSQNMSNFICKISDCCFFPRANLQSNTFNNFCSFCSQKDRSLFGVDSAINAESGANSNGKKRYCYLKAK